MCPGGGSSSRWLANTDGAWGARVEATWRVEPRLPSQLQRRLLVRGAARGVRCNPRNRRCAPWHSRRDGVRRRIVAKCSRAHHPRLPIVATSETLARTGGVRRCHAELVARIRGAPAPTAAAIERFPATWRRVTLPRAVASRTGDCKLVRAVVKQVLPRLATLVQRTPMCIGGVTRAMPLEVVALVRDPVAGS